MDVYEVEYHDITGGISSIQVGCDSVEDALKYLRESRKRQDDHYDVTKRRWIYPVVISVKTIAANIEFPEKVTSTT